MSSIPKPDRPQMPSRRSTFAQAAQANEPTPRPQAPIDTSVAAPRRATRNVMLQLDDDLKQRLAATQTFTAGHTGLRSQQAFIREAIRRLCTELERDYNGGEQFPPVPEP